jgi:hypothetical protein
MSPDRYLVKGEVMKEISLVALLSGTQVPPKRGRPRKIQDTDTVETLRKMREDGVDPKDMAKLLGVHLATIYRYLKKADDTFPQISPVVVTKCKVCNWVGTQDHKKTDAIRDWVADGLDRRRLFGILRNGGLTASETTFRNHLNQCIQEKTHVGS